jgi:signal transduction histidine kinase
LQCAATLAYISNEGRARLAHPGDSGDESPFATQVGPSDHEEGKTSMTPSSPVREPLLELYDALAQYQLREAGAEVAAAIAHAVGTPLNVISGRAELIRHDPSNALAQVARIEEQVKKLATGLRQLVDYLAQPEPRSPQSPQRPGSGVKRSGDEPPAGWAAAEPLVVDAASVLDELSKLAAPLASACGVVLVVEGKAVEGTRVERWQAFGTLTTLVSAALRHAAALGPGAANERVTPPRVRVSASVVEQGVSFSLEVPGLTLIEGWQLEHFQARPLAADCPEFFRTMSVCGAVVRGHGGRLLAEASPNGEGIVVRFTSRTPGL